MGELIRIGAEEGAPGLGATIDTAGAWVTSLSMGKDHVLFPRDLVATGPDELKLRGGMHVCSPYFGADRIGAQHGWARDAEWQPMMLAENVLLLKNPSFYSDFYPGFWSELVYYAGRNTFTASLTVSNRRGAIWSVPIAPGFHPYFSGPGEAGPVPIFEHPKGADPERIIRLANGLDVIMRTENLPGTVRWSDNPEEYHCVEPIASSRKRKDGIFTRTNLKPGETRKYKLEIGVQEAS